MTNTERKQFDKELERISRRAYIQACDLCATITIPLEIEALIKMREEIQTMIDSKQMILDNIKDKYNL